VRSSDRKGKAPASRKQTRNRLRLAILAIVVAWVYAYNALIKEQGGIRSFFEIIDTISDDFVVGTLLTVLVGAGIVGVFSATKLYTQIVANVYSFKVIEDLVHGELRRREYRAFFAKLLKLEDLENPSTCCPDRVSTLLFSFSFMYLMSWVYLMLFSEALFFVSWSAGVNLLVDSKNLLLLPTLALSIPFSARVMAYLRYPYAQDYADFMPGAVFVLLVVAALGGIFESDDQVFFLEQVFSDRANWAPFIRNGAFLAFIPVFFEAGFWLYELNRQDSREPEADPAEGDS